MPRLSHAPHKLPAYRAASHAVMQRLRARTPMVEQISIDEAFLDVSDLSTRGEMLAQQLQAQIREELGLPCSIGVTTNKLVAKVATDVGRTSARNYGPPNAVCSVPPGVEAAFLAPLPAIALWGQGHVKVRSVHLHGPHLCPGQPPNGCTSRVSVVSRRQPSRSLPRIGGHTVSATTLTSPWLWGGWHEASGTSCRARPAYDRRHRRLAVGIIGAPFRTAWPCPRSPRPRSRRPTRDYRTCCEVRFAGDHLPSRC